MARIPLTQIPNAPELLDPVLTKYPDTRVDLSEMARRLQQGGIQQGSFDGPAKGLQAMGEAVGQAGNVFQQVGERMMESKNQADLARVEDIMSQARAEHAQEMQSLPEDQWVPTWEQKYRPLVEKRIDALHLSPMVRGRVIPQLVHFDATTRSSLTYDALKQTASRNLQDLENGVTEAVQSQDFARAQANVGRMVAGHLITPEQGQARQLKIKGQQEDYLVDDAVAGDAHALLKDLTAAQHTGHSALLPFLNGRKIDIARTREMAENEVEKRSIYALRGAQDDAAQKMPLPEILKKYGEDLSPRHVHILEATEHSFRQWDPAKDGPAAEKITQQIGAYRRQNDPDLNTYDRIQQSIAELPSDKQAPLRMTLLQQYEKSTKEQKEPSARDQQLSHWLGEANRLGESGYLGDTGRSRKNFNVITDPKQSAAYGEKLLNIRVQLQDWSKQNPRATAEQWGQQFQQVLRPYIDEHVSQATAPEGLYDSGGAAEPQATPVPITHFSLGRDVGGADPVQDSNTNRGYSALGPNLTPGSAAVNTNKYPLGTIFRDNDTGEVFLATDRHNNEDHNVVDLYQSPDRYQDTKTSRNLSVIGRAAHIPHNAEELRKFLASLGNVPEGESAAETLARLKGANLARK
ncbi:hypothetical protein BH09VER1_BH09VER1_46300 [soil metagenome]